MASKEELKKQFSREYKKFYEVELFKEKGFARHQCKHCNKFYWSLDSKRTDDCGDSSHTDYSFFREKTSDETYVSFWKKFESFFKKNGHTSIPRYPVTASWRDDLYFTIASIADFQRLENGKIAFEYPANPLIVPQICLRFPDIANVGITGRHLSCFTMAGQHSFNYPKEGYWKDECVRLNFEFLTKVLGVNENELVYGEDLWNMPDFSAFGPSIESFANGLELVNSVFMQYYLFKNEMKDLQMKVIDVGWGLERLLWYQTGKPTVYDATFPKQIEFIKKQGGVQVDQKMLKKYSVLSSKLNIEEAVNIKLEREKIANTIGISVKQLNEQIRPLQATYAIADHTRTLLFALTDGALPSNMAGGYNLRVILRRALSFNEEVNLNVDLMKIIEMHAHELKEIYPELSNSENMDNISKILDVEKRKFEDTKEKAKNTVIEILNKGEKITTEKMITLYQSNGITPETIENIAKKEKKEIEIPSEFYSKITEKNVMTAREKEAKNELVEEILTKNLPETKATYYFEPNNFSQKAKIIYISKKFKAVVLDKTSFYPESGGQMTDLGTINENPVEKVEKKGGIIIHFLKTFDEIELNSEADCQVDGVRRRALQLHHSGAHVIIQSARRILGSHVWQAGSKKDVDDAHIDITHYEKPSREQINEIENLANEVVREGKEIIAKEMDRREAEIKFGFKIYQGGGAISNRIRIIEIKNFDVQACGGIHAQNTSNLGLLKIVKAEAIQDGIIRLQFKAGIAAIKYIQNQDEKIENVCRELGIPKEELEKAVHNLFESMKDAEKKLEKASEIMLEKQAFDFVEEAKKKKAHTIEKRLQQTNNFVEKMAPRIIEEAEKQKLKITAIISNEENFITVATNFEDAIQILKSKGARGGGRKELAKGKII